MTPLVESILVASAILGAVAYFVTPLFRRSKGKQACSSGCCAPRKVTAVKQG